MINPPQEPPNAHLASWSHLVPCVYNRPCRSTTTPMLSATHTAVLKLRALKSLGRSWDFSVSQSYGYCCAVVLLELSGRRLPRILYFSVSPIKGFSTTAVQPHSATPVACSWGVIICRRLIPMAMSASRVPNTSST